MTNLSSTATTFGGFQSGVDTSVKILPTPAVTSTSGEMAKFQSTKVGGNRRRKTSTKKRKTSKRSNKRTNKRTQKNRN